MEVQSEVLDVENCHKVVTIVEKGGLIYSRLGLKCGKRSERDK